MTLPVTPEAMRAWRERLGLSQRRAAAALGVSERMYIYYEQGHREGRPVPIPRTVALACSALEAGLGGDLP